MTEKEHNRKNFLFAFLSWTTLIAQLVLILQNRVVSVLETLVRYFSFFTILTNILVAIVFSVLCVNPNNRLKFFLRYNVITAVGVYIFVVGFVYNTILRFIWQPHGLQLIVDEMLHLILPIIYIVSWFYNNNNYCSINWKDIYIWLIYPLVYLTIILILGSFSNYYPYPFVNVFELGYQTVFINCILLTLFFGVVSVMFVGISRLRSRK